MPPRGRGGARQAALGRGGSPRLCRRPGAAARRSPSTPRMPGPVGLGRETAVPRGPAATFERPSGRAGPEGPSRQTGWGGVGGQTEANAPRPPKRGEREPERTDAQRKKASASWMTTIKKGRGCGWGARVFLEAELCGAGARGRVLCRERRGEGRKEKALRRNAWQLFHGLASEGGNGRAGTLRGTTVTCGKAKEPARIPKSASDAVSKTVPSGRAGGRKGRGRPRANEK